MSSHYTYSVDHLAIAERHI